MAAFRSRCTVFSLADTSACAPDARSLPQTYDSVWGDMNRDAMDHYIPGGGTCPITADCVGVPHGGGSGIGSETSHDLVQSMVGCIFLPHRASFAGM